MGFVTSFLIIIIAGFWSYLLYHRYGLSKGHKAWIAWYAFIIVGGLMILDTLIYFGFLDFVFPIINQFLGVNIENRMIRFRQSVQYEHTEYRSSCCKQDRQFKGNDDECRPAVQGSATDVERIDFHRRVVLQKKSGDGTDDCP